MVSRTAETRNCRSRWLIKACAARPRGGAFGQQAATLRRSPYSSKDQIANVHLGRSTELTPLDLPESNPVRQFFYKKATDRDAAQVKAVWARINFTGRGKPPKELPDATAVKKAVAADPKAIGYILKSDVDSTVNVILSLD